MAIVNKRQSKMSTLINGGYSHPKLVWDDNTVTVFMAPLKTIFLFTSYLNLIVDWTGKQPKSLPTNTNK